MWPRKRAHPFGHRRHKSHSAAERQPTLELEGRAPARPQVRTASRLAGKLQRGSAGALRRADVFVPQRTQRSHAAQDPRIIVAFFGFLLAKQHRVPKAKFGLEDGYSIPKRGSQVGVVARSQSFANGIRLDSPGGFCLQFPAVCRKAFTPRRATRSFPFTPRMSSNFQLWICRHPGAKTQFGPKMRAALTVFVLVFFSVLTRAGDVSKQAPPDVLNKAEAILEHADVFATAHVGFAGENISEEAWAFTAILKHSADAEVRFLRVVDHALPAGALYCLLGLREIKSQRYGQLRLQALATLKADGDVPVEVLHIDSMSLDESLSGLIESLDRIRVSEYILDPLPDFFRTRRTIPTERKDRPNQAAEPTRTTVTPPAGAGDRASGARGSP